MFVFSIHKEPQLETIKDSSLPKLEAWLLETLSNINLSVISNY